jgi:hypothetical protein
MFQTTIVEKKWKYTFYAQCMFSTSAFEYKQYGLEIQELLLCIHFQIFLVLGRAENHYRLFKCVHRCSAINPTVI